MQSMTGCGTDFKQIQQMADISESLHHNQTFTIGSASFRIENYFLHFIYTIEKASCCRSHRPANHRGDPLLHR